MSLLLPAGGATVAPVLVASFEARDKTGTDTSSAFTFSSVALGAAASDRLIVVGTGIVSNVPGTLSACTIGGVSATKLKEISFNDAHTAMWVAAVPTGTTGDIVLTPTATGESWGVGVWRLTGASATPTDDASSTADPFALTISCDAGGVIIGFSILNVITAVTWAEIDEDFDEVIETNKFHNGAHKVFSASQTDLAVTCTGDSPATNRGAVAASFGLA